MDTETRRLTGTIEPVSILWTTLKTSFVLIILILFVETAFMMYFALTLGIMIRFQQHWATQMSLSQAILDLVIIIQGSILVAIESLIGLIGIIRVDFALLKSFMILNKISFLLSITAFFFTNFKLIPLGMALLQFVTVAVTHRMIQMIVDANCKDLR